MVLLVVVGLRLRLLLLSGECKNSFLLLLEVAMVMVVLWTGK